MLAGEMYDPLDPELVAARARARDLCQELNATRESDAERRRRILRDLFGKGGDTVWMQPPFYCDYGSNIELGERVFFNFNCTVLDVCSVRIGDFTLFGPSVQIYTPLASIQRRATASRRVRKADRDRVRRVGRRRSDHSRRRTDWISSRHRSRQRCDARCPGRRLRRGQSVPGHPRDHRVNQQRRLGSLRPLMACWLRGCPQGAQRSFDPATVLREG